MTKKTRTQKKKSGMFYWFVLTLSALSTFWGAHWIADAEALAELVKNDEEQAIRVASQQGRNQPITRSQSSR